MNRPVLIFSMLAVTTASLAADRPQLETATAEWKKSRSYASLRIIAEHLHQGMRRADVERLLGEVHYSAGEGSGVYYSSDKRGPQGDSNLIATFGLVVEYMQTSPPYTVTDRVQRWILGPIGE